MARKNIHEEELFFSKSDQYLNTYLPSQVSKSPSTVRQYRTGLSAFFDYLAVKLEIDPSEFRFDQCSYEFFLDYLQFLQSEGKSPATVNVRIVAVRQYLSYIADVNMTAMPAYIHIKKVSGLTVPKEIRPIIQKKDVSSLLEAPSESWFGRRDRFIIIFLFDLMLRADELTKIRLGDLTFTEDMVIVSVHGKGRKERELVLSDKCAAHLEEFLKTYHAEGQPKDRPLFYTKSHGEYHEMTVRNVERIVSNYGNVARRENSSIPEKVYPHMLRRTKATLLLQDGMEMARVSELLGHESVETTRTHYATYSLEQKREALNKASGQIPEIESDQTPVWKKGINDLKKKYGLH
jgi:site-specific recombinase XerD